VDNQNVDQAGRLVDVLQIQVDFLLAMISRPVVQQQILAMLLILIVAWLLTEAVRRWQRRRGSARELSDMTGVLRGQRRFVAIYDLLAPILALVFFNFTVWLFAQQGIPNGLLEGLTILIWIWLIYRLLAAGPMSHYGEAFRPYQNRFVKPFFLLLVLQQLSTVLPGSAALAGATIKMGTISITLGNLLTAAIILYLFFVAAWAVKQMMLHSLPSRLHAEPGLVESSATLARYALLALGIILSLGVLGLDFSSLAIVAGGLSVGIGIGLQDFVANFISGLILLFEQTLRPGDVVELEGRISQVDKISLRATVVRTRTNEEVIIPNSKFTNEPIKNLTKSSRLVRVIVPLGVSYKSDPEVIRQLATETAMHHHLVLTDPPPALLFLGYGDSSIDFNLSVSVNQPEMSGVVRSDLYYMLWKVFAEHDVEIPFPQRDLNLGKGWEKLGPDLKAV
jgi:potassium efflux system protein